MSVQGYKYEVHMHTYEASACGRTPGAEYIAEFKRLGSDKTYDYYTNTAKGTDTEKSLGELIKKCTDYKEYFLDKIIEREYTDYNRTITRQQAESFFSSTSYTRSRRSAPFSSLLPSVGTSPYLTLEK